MVAMPIDLLYIWPFLWPVNIWHDKRIGHLRRYTRNKILKRFVGFKECVTYYTGSLGKIICLAMKIITKDVRWDARGEQLDKLFASFPYGASNVVTIIQKK